jgi:phage-related protein
MPAQAGSAYIPIRPDLTGFHKTIQKELQAALGPIVARIAKQIGVDLKDGIGQGLGDPVSGPLEESTRKQRSKAPKDGEQIGGAFAGAFKRRVTDALKSLPKAEITADSSEADRKVAELRTRMAELSKKTIGIDIDAAAALAELSAIKSALADVGQNASIDVRADTAAAIRQLDTVQATVDKLATDTATVEVDADTAGADAALALTDAEVKRLDGRKASIDVDVSGAMSGLGRLAGMVGGLAPLFLGLGAAGVAGIGALAAPAAAGAAGFGALALVAVPAITRIKTALDAQNQAQQNSAATAVQAQQRALAEAGAQQQLAAAVRNAAVAHAQAVDQVRTAEQQLAAAQQSAVNAQRALTQARLDSRRALQDMKNQIIDVGLSVQQSRLDVDSARASLDQMRAAATAAAQNLAQAKTALAQAQAAQAALGPGGGDAARTQAAANVAAAQAAVKAAQQQKAARDADAKSAQIAYQQAVQRLKEQQLQLQRLQQDERAAAKAGVDGSNQVLAARQRLAAANLQITNSERALAAARANVARVDANSRDQIASAQRGVTQASLQGAAANSALTQSVAALSPAARGLMGAWQRLSAAFTTWQTSLEPTVLPVLARGLGLVQAVLPLLTPLVRGAAAAMDTLISAVKTALASPAWQTFFATLGTLVKSTLITLGTVLIQVATAVVRFANAFAPFAPIALGFITQLGNLFSMIFGQLGAMAPVLAAFIGVLGQLFQAVGPLLVSALQGLAPVLAGLAPIFGVVIRSLQPVIAALIAGLRPILAALVPVIGLVIGALGQILGALAPILPVLGQFIASLITGLMPILRPIIKVITQVAVQLAGALITALKAALPSVQQIVIAIASLLPALLPLIPLWVKFELALLPLIPTLLRLVALLVQILVPVLRIVITVLVAVAGTILKILLPVFRFMVAAITAAINSVHKVFKWLYDVLIGHSIIPDLVHGIQHWLGILGAAFRAVYTTVIRPVVHSIGTVIDTVWKGTIRPAFNAIKSALSSVGHAFGVASSAIKAAWSKVKGYVASPVRFFVETVYDKGVVGLWNKVMGWLHLGKTVGTLAPIHVPGLASGGELSAAQPISPMRTNGPMAIVGEGNPAYPEYVIPTDPKHRGRAAALWAAAGGDLQMLASGGVLGSILKGVKGVAGKVFDLGKDALGLLADPKGVWDRLAKPILDKVKGSGALGAGDWGKAIAAVPPKLLGGLWSAAKPIIDAFKSAFGGGGSAMVELAKTQIGYREGAGNSNKYSNELGRPPEEWCADFIDWLALKTNNRSAVPWTASAPGMANAFGSRYQPGTAGVTPGDILFFGGSKGTIYHVGLASGPAAGGSVPTIAGNSSNMVRAYRGTGIAGFAHPAYPNPGSIGSAPGSLIHASPPVAQAWARQNLKNYHWSQSQFAPLLSLWNRESGWRWSARNPSSGAYGIPQALPGSKMAAVGRDWRDNAGTQIKWGLGYINSRYGSPGNAWAHSQRTGWYDDGGYLQPGLTLAWNATRKPEPVFSHDQWNTLAAATRGGDGATYETTYNLHHRDITLPQLQALQRQQEARQRVGRPR